VITQSCDGFIFSNIFLLYDPDVSVFKRILNLQILNWATLELKLNLDHSFVGYTDDNLDKQLIGGARRTALG
jgi:hypothetical protein